VPEVAETCEALKVCGSIEFLIVWSVDVSLVVAALELKETEGPALGLWARFGRAVPLELAGGETLSLPVFVVAAMISLRLQLPVWSPR
jgi:hypothetical protein